MVRKVAMGAGDRLAAFQILRFEVRPVGGSYPLFFGSES